MAKLVSDIRRSENIIPVVDEWEEGSRSKGWVWEIENIYIVVSASLSLDFSKCICILGIVIWSGILNLFS